MELKLYKTVSTPNTINKVLTDLQTVQITVRRDFDILNPVLFLKGNFTGFNYCHIPDLNKFYLIENATMVNGSVCRLSCTTDVLETYKADILAGEYQFTRDYKDGDQHNVNRKTSVYKFEVLSSNVELEPDNKIILTVAGE